jgi:hypothetical protein
MSQELIQDGLTASGFLRKSGCAPAVEKKISPRLTGPVSGGVLFKVICRAQNPPAEMRGGFCIETRRNSASGRSTAICGEHRPGYRKSSSKPGSPHRIPAKSAYAPAVEKKI